MNIPVVFGFLRWQDIIDITIVALLIYQILIWTRNRSATRLMQGVLSILVLYTISHFFQFKTIEWLLQKLTTIVLFVVLIVFQPELRQFLEKLGKSTELKFFLMQNKVEEGLFSIQFIQNLVRVVDFFSENKIGSLIVIEQVNSLDSIKETGIELNADYSNELLISVFYGRNPLHDGAAVITGSTLSAAGCLLPLTQTKLRDRSLGTRHRAALGLVELTDAVVIVTSEETGTISIAKDGKLYRRLGRKKLQEYLFSYLDIEIGNQVKEETIQDRLSNSMNRFFHIFRKQS